MSKVKYFYYSKVLKIFTLPYFSPYFFPFFSSPPDSRLPVLVSATLRELNNQYLNNQYLNNQYLNNQYLNNQYSSNK